MGYFCLEESNSKKDLVEAAKRNLELWIDADGGCDYLFDFAIGQLEKAKESNEQNSKEEQK